MSALEDLLGNGLSPHVSSLATMIRSERGQGKVAAFDFDNTCIKGDLSETLLLMMEAQGEGQLVEPYEAACKRDLRSAYIELVHTLVSGRTEAEVWSRAQQAWDWGVSSGRLSHRPGMRQLIAALQLHGWEVWVVTASPSSVVRPIAATIGIGAHRVLGMASKVSDLGTFLPELIQPIPYREGKGELLRLFAGADAFFAAGDSQYDLGILKPATYCLLYDRGDAELKALGEEKGWWILEGR